MENNIVSIFPISLIVLFSLIILIWEIFNSRKRNYSGYISLIGIIISSIFTIVFWNKNYSYFKNGLILDNFSLLFFFLFYVSFALVILLSFKYIALQKMNYGEYFSLLLLCLAGMMIVVSSNDILIILLGLEVFSLANYVLAGLKLGDLKSSEASIKYFLLGAFASAFLIYGIAFLYGICDSTKINVIADSFLSGEKINTFALIGFGLFLIGMFFKIAVVPFHVWTPDVYQGAPTPITALFSVATKAAGFAVLIRVFSTFWPIKLGEKVIFWSLWAIAVLTMVIGNLVALRQRNIKRILAYSSIAHAGYMMIAIIIKDYKSLIFYIIVYIFMNIGAFAVISAMTKENKEYLDLEEYSGIGFKYPWLGATLSVFLISLAGFPPTAGFLAKFYIFSSAVRNNLITLTIIAVLCSLISVFYYLRVIVYMYMKPSIPGIKIEVENPPLFLVLFICLLGVLQLGIFPANVIYYINQAISSLTIF
ncbi:NADH-quinone oxidoreductase subunit N [Candidatus Aminicenantes bacterium AC-334-E05]|nr:NADH-quinone oxidoreductase subunit N [Candidatus Aminicenantes bacterium AC-334-E05]